MYEELIKSFSNLSLENKKEKNIEELKLISATLELLCDQKNIKYKKNRNNYSIENEDDFQNYLYGELVAIKEELGAYIIENEK